MADQADQETQDAWKGILFAHSKVARALEADLLTNADLPHIINFNFTTGEIVHTW